MKILFLGCHSILEYDMMRIFTEMDHTPTVEAKLNIEIFSLLGSYMNPTQAGDYLRNVIPHGRHYQNLYGIALQCDKDNIHDELLQWCDVVLMTHNSRLPHQKVQQPWLVNNWEKIKKYNKKCIWYSIGQSTPAIERELKSYMNDGLKVVRYSPYEQFLPDYAGAHAMIRFGKDKEEFTNWTGDVPEVVTVAQSYKKRGDHLRFDLFDQVTAGFKRRVYGTENADLGELWAGDRTYEELKKNLREARVFFYFGTIPAPYTLSLMEAMMTGIPVVAVGPNLRDHHAYNWRHYEIPEIITNGANGFMSNDITELRGYVQLLLTNHERARQIGAQGRKRAIELFDKLSVMRNWRDFLKSI